MQLISNITDFNNQLRYHINVVINEIKNKKYLEIKPSPSMLLLLVISSPFNCPLFQTKITTQIDCQGLGLLPSAEVGPIVPGIRELINSPLHLTDKNLLQIFGHYSTGVGISITDVSLAPKGPQSLLVNLDVANTFSHVDPVSFNSSRAIIIYRQNIIDAHSHFSTNTIQKQIVEKPVPLTITIDDDLHNLREIQKYAHHKIRRGIFNQLYFHGIDKQHTPNLAIFTLNNKQYGPGNFGVKYFFIPVTNKKWYDHIQDQADF